MRDVLFTILHVLLEGFSGGQRDNVDSVLRRILIFNEVHPHRQGHGSMELGQVIEPLRFPRLGLLFILLWLRLLDLVGGVGQGDQGRYVHRYLFISPVTHVDPRSSIGIHFNDGVRNVYLSRRCWCSVQHPGSCFHLTRNSDGNRGACSRLQPHLLFRSYNRRCIHQRRKDIGSPTLVRYTESISPSVPVRGTPRVPSEIPSDEWVGELGPFHHQEPAPEPTNS